MTEIQLTIRQILGDRRYEECIDEARKQEVAGRTIGETESRDDLLAVLGVTRKAIEECRANFRAMFLDRKVLEDGDSGRIDWMEEDLRRCLSIFRFARAEGLTIRQAIDWLAGHTEDAELPAEFIAAFGEANK